MTEIADDSRIVHAAAMAKSNAEHGAAIQDRLTSGARARVPEVGADCTGWTIH